MEEQTAPRDRTRSVATECVSPMTGTASVDGLRSELLAEAMSDESLVDEMLARKRLTLEGRSPAPRMKFDPAAPPPQVGDPWIDAYLKLRHACDAGMPAADLIEYAQELRLTLPGPPPPGGSADIFVRMDAAMTAAPVDVLLAPRSPLWTPDA